MGLLTTRKKGSDLVMLINSSITACAVNCDVTMQVSEIEVNNEVNGTALDFDPDTEDWVINCDYLFTHSTFSDMYLLKRQVISVAWQDKNLEGYYYSGQGFITRLNLVARMNDVARYSISIRIKGDITREVFNLIDGTDALENRIDESGNNLIT